MGERKFEDKFNPRLKTEDYFLLHFNIYLRQIIYVYCPFIMK